MDDVEDADCFIFASPNYFGEINAQGHIFMDRFYSMTKNTCLLDTSIAKVSELVDIPLEINLYYRTPERIENIERVYKLSLIHI